MIQVEKGYVAYYTQSLLKEKFTSIFPISTPL